MLRYALAIPPVLLFTAPALAEEVPPVPYEEALRCGVLNSLMSAIQEGDAEQVRIRDAMALTWFTVAREAAKMDDAALRAKFDPIHAAEGEAVLAQPEAGSARIDFLLTKLKACDKLKKAHFDIYYDTAEFLKTADAAQFANGSAHGRQGAEPPPIPRKDLTFGDGWTFQSRGNNCTATRSLGKGLTLQLAYTNFSDGYIWVSGKGLPRIDGDAYEAEEAKHSKGSGTQNIDEDHFIDALDAGLTYATFPGTGVFFDGELGAAFVYGETTDGETSYKLGTIQSHVWPRLKKAKELRVKALGKELGVVQLPAAGGLWDEMQTCIDQYPDG